MTDRERIINQVQGMASKAFHSLGAKEVNLHEDNSVSTPLNGYTVKIHIEVTKDRRNGKI